ncbi:MAG TPA: FAD-dependent oxidoreductase [Burkholderiales bacterium]|nr:FAD-dependent oxidoreductase [Burkholderiales bacterium]
MKVEDIAARAPSRFERMQWIASFMGVVSDAFYFAKRSLGPIADVLIRVWLAQIFLVSGLLKAANWDNALYLSANEYPVTWMDPVTAAYLGVIIECVGAVMLALGLGTRLAAAAMLILTLVIQLNYLALDVHLFWAVLLGWFVFRGAGVFSIDRLLSRGAADSALPFAAATLRTFQWISVYAAPIYSLLLRVWLAAALAIASVILVSSINSSPVWESIPRIGHLLPLRSAADFAGAFALVCAILLFIGLATRLTSLALIAALFGTAVVNPWHTETGYWIAALALIALYGPGKISLDKLLDLKLKKIYPQLEGKPAFSLYGLPRVVIVGAGFGGLSCAAALRRARVSVTLIDRHNYHLFQPLLYQVATASLAPGDIAATVRGMFREQFNTRVVLGNVTGVDTAQQRVLIGEQRLPYDYLVLATGAAHSYFGKDQWAPYAPGLKRVEDATEVRRRLLLAFERAENTEDKKEREALLTFLIVGAGPTGVELAGAIAELARFGMEKEFRHFDPAQARVLLVQSAPRILPTFPEKLSEIAKASLEKLGVEVLLNSRVENIDDEGVTVSGKRIASRTVLWAAGVVASPAAKWLGVEADNAGRVKVGPDLSIAGLPTVFAIGDTALSAAWNGNSVPGLAPAAKQGGEYVAKVIRAKVSGRKEPAAFQYRHLGSLATIGRKSAVADFGFVRMSGAVAWWLWGAVHVAFLVGLRNRVSVMFDWFWAYLTYRGGTRLITGTDKG